MIVTTCRNTQRKCLTHPDNIYQSHLPSKPLTFFVRLTNSAKGDQKPARKLGAGGDGTHDLVEMIHAAEEKYLPEIEKWKHRLQVDWAFDIVFQGAFMKIWGNVEWIHHKLFRSADCPRTSFLYQGEVRALPQIPD